MNKPYLISKISHINYLQKAVKKTVTDEDAYKLIKDGVLIFEKLIDREQIDSNSEIIYNLSYIKSANTLVIDGLNFSKLSIKLSFCSFNKIHIQNSIFYSVDVMCSTVSEIYVKKCTVEANFNISHNENLEIVILNSLNTNLVRFAKLENLRTIQLFGNKIENFDLQNIRILPKGYFKLDTNSIKKVKILDSKINIDLNLYFGSSSLSKVFLVVSQANTVG